MSWKIGMPNLGHTMEEGKVSEWLKALGQPVNKGEVIAVVESDKAFKPSRHSDIGLAVATPSGLVTAVVSEAQTKSISALHTEIGSLAASARMGRLNWPDLRSAA